MKRIEYKLIRIILLIAIVLAAMVVLPRYYRMFFRSNSLYSKVGYSELLNDFIITEYKNQEEGDNTYVLYSRDTKGNTYSSHEADSLMPSSNVEQLVYEKRFPDSIVGIPVTAKMINEAKHNLYNVNFVAHDYGLYDMRDRQSTISKEWETVDLLRFREDRVEFVVSKTNEIDDVKSELFTKELNDNQFKWPCKKVFQPNSKSLVESVGFFIIDGSKALYRLSMNKRLPVVEKLKFEEEETIRSVYFTDRGDFLALITTNGGELYKMSADYSYSKLPLPSVVGKSIEMRAGFFYHLFIISDGETSEYCVLDKDYQFVNMFIHDRLRRGENYQKVATYIFPCQMWQTPNDGFSLEWSSFVHFIWLNIILTLVILMVRRKQNWNLFNIDILLDTLVVLIFGIFGFIAVLLLAGEKNNRKYE